MPGYGQFSLNVSFSTSFSPNLLTFSFFIFYSVLFWGHGSPWYTPRPRRPAKIKWKLKEVAKLLLHSRTRLLITRSQTGRLKQRIMPLETHLILWLRLSWGDQVFLPYLSSLNYHLRVTSFLLLPKVIRSQKHKGSGRRIQCGADSIW